MSIRFAIKNTASKAEKEGDVFIRFSGTAEPFMRVSERTAIEIGRDEKDNAVLSYVTGLDEGQVDFFGWYSDAEKDAVRKTVQDLKPVVERYYGGATRVDPKNKSFWGNTRDVSRLSLSHEDIDQFYDTKNPAHALLYLSIISGAFIDLVAPTREWADKFQIPHYLMLDTEEVFDEDDDVTRSDAHAALAELRKNADPEALFILAWCIHFDTTGFGGYNKATPFNELVSYHIKYIDGKLVSKKKRNTPRVFLDYVEKWNGQQTRPAVYTEAYVKAGEWFGYINQREKKYTTADGTVLGNTVDEAVANLKKAKYNQDFETLREKVEAKWKE